MISREQNQNTRISICYSNEEKYLTYRQAQCLAKLVKGKRLKVIGKELEISPRTVEGYLNTLKERLGCAERSDLIRIALESNFIKLLNDFDN